MGIATFLIGVMPTYSAIGLWAALLLIVLRVCQGVGVGGEWGGSVLMSMEWHRGNRRGFIASWPQAGVPIGLALSIGAVRVASAWTGDGFTRWGWRIPFLLSALLILVGLFIRLRVLETPLFARVLAQKEVAKAPVPEAVQRHWPEIVLSALARLAEQAPFYIFTTYVLTYGTAELGLKRNFLLNAVLLAAAVSLFTTPFFGYLSDVIGQRRVARLPARLGRRRRAGAAARRLAAAHLPQRVRDLDIHRADGRNHHSGRDHARRPDQHRAGRAGDGAGRPDDGRPDLTEALRRSESTP